MGYADYTIKKGTIDEIPESMKTFAGDLSKYVTEIEEIKRNLAISQNKQSITGTMSGCVDDINIEVKRLQEMSTALSSILALYYNTEKTIAGTGNADKSGPTWEAADPNAQPVEPEKENWEDKIKKELGLSDDEWDVIKTFLEIIIGCIPVVNCIYGMYDLVETIKEAREDGDVTGWEKAAIAFGVVSVIGDAIQVGTLVKTIGKAMSKATKATKLAKTAAKTTKENAEKAAKTAAKKAAKASGAKPTSKAAKEANKWQKEADKMAKKVVKKEEAYKKAKKDLINTPKEETKKQFKKNVDKLKDDVQDPKEYAKGIGEEVADKQAEKERKKK